MIRIATVFSGIGAPEQALKEIGKDFEIVFACDNGERYIEFDETDILKEMKSERGLSKQDAVKRLYEQSGKPNNVKKSYFANYDISEDRWFDDIRYLDGKPFKNKVDLFVGGSPCQTFSTYGFRKGLEDTRGTLFYDYARLIKEIRPKAFVFENVTGILNHDKGKTWDIIIKTFKSLGYDIKVAVLNASNYNLPQLRKRVFAVGIDSKRKYKDFSFPEAVALTKDSKDYLEKNIPDKYYLGEKGFNFVTKVERNERRARVNQKIIGCQTANQQFNWIGDFRVEKPKKRHYEDKRIYVGKYEGHDAVARQLTPRETLRLMGFQDSFNIVVDDKTMWRQTGNSIAIPVMKAVIEEILKVIEED